MNVVYVGLTLVSELNRIYWEVDGKDLKCSDLIKRCMALKQPLTLLMESPAIVNSKRETLDSLVCVLHDCIDLCKSYCGKGWMKKVYLSALKNDNKFAEYNSKITELSSDLQFEVGIYQAISQAEKMEALCEQQRKQQEAFMELIQTLNVNIHKGMNDTEIKKNIMEAVKDSEALHATVDEDDSSAANNMINYMDDLDLGALVWSPENEKLGKGGFGTVYKGTYHGVERAIKHLELATHPTESELKKAYKEIRVLKKVKHPCIVGFLGASMSKGLIVLELCCCSLYDLLHGGAENPSTGRISKDVLMDFGKKLLIANDICLGLKYLDFHEIVHRDIKSGNILLSINENSTTGFTAKIADFGLATASTFTVTATSASSDRAVGSDAYMAPELLDFEDEMRPPYSHKSDVYAFGILCNEMMTRTPPWSGCKISTIISKVAFHNKRPQLYQPPDEQPLEKEFMLKCVGDETHGALHQNPEERININEFNRHLVKIMESVNGTSKSVVDETLMHIIATSNQENGSIFAQLAPSPSIAEHDSIGIDLSDVVCTVSIGDNETTTAVSSVSAGNDAEMYNLYYKIKLGDWLSLFKLEEMVKKGDKPLAKGYYALLMYASGAEGGIVASNMQRSDAMFAELLPWLDKECASNQPDALFIRGNIEYFGMAGTSKDLVACARYYEKSSNKGFPPSHHAMAFCYEYGIGVKADNEKAIHLYTLGCDKSYYRSLEILGNKLKNGTGIAMDVKRGLDCIKAAADIGYSTSQNSLGVFYETGDGVPQDLEKAFEYYRKASLQENLSALFNLASCYVNGKGVSRSESKGIRLYERAARLGHAESIKALEERNLKCPKLWSTGHSSEIDYNVVLDLFEKTKCGKHDSAKALKKLVDEGCRIAMGYYSVLLFNSKPDGLVKKSESKSHHMMELLTPWLDAKCAIGNMHAQYVKGSAYFSGIGGVEPNFELAVHWFALSATQGLASAMCHLAWCYFSGSGTEKNLTESVRLYTLAVEKGHAQAEFNLGLYYLNGTGVTENKNEAVRLFKLSAEQGNTNALSALENL